MHWPCWPLQIHLYPTIMSTTSTMTASAARDCIPSNVADLSNHMCLFILTRGNGTLFDASSILEEDIIEMCIQLGHTHPKAVLLYSAVESLVLFHTADKLQIVTHGVMKASMLHDEVIRVRTSPPSANHVRAYMAVVGGDPSGTQPPPSDGEEEPHLSPSNPHLGGRTPQHLQANLGDLADNEFCQLMEDLCWKVAETPQQHLGEILWEMGILMQMTGRSPFWEGEGGFPLEQPFQPPAPAQPDGGWEPRGQPPHPSTCSTWWGCRAPNKYTSHGVVTW